ncbi:MAG: proton-conducting transporter membrane subunit [Verrucomicrobiota bacterium]
MTELLQHPMVMPIAFTFLAGLVCLLLPRAWDAVRAALAVAASAFTVALAWRVFSGPRGILNWGAWLSLRVDGLSAFVLLATAVFGFLIALYSVGFMKGRERQREYYAYLLWTLGLSFGAVLANDLVLLLVFWGCLGLAMYLMIGLAGPEASKAAKKALVIVGGSDSVMMLGVLLFWRMAGSTRMDGEALALGRVLAHVAFFSLVAAALAKAGSMPFHTWVPDCGEKAPVPVAALLPASLDKLLGIYLLVRVVNGLFVMSPGARMLLMAVGAATVILAVMMALVQHDMKRLLSYHAVSQVGYMVLGICSGNPVGLAGGLFHMLNNALYKTALFLTAGAVEQKTGTTDLDKLGGLAKAMPLTFVAFVVTALSISGIPPLNGFASKWMVYQGIISSGGQDSLWVVWLAAAMLGSALTLASFVKVLHAVFLRKPATDVRERRPREVGPTMFLPPLVLAAACIVFGVLAYRLPLRGLIFPAVPAGIYLSGVWWAGAATAMLAAAFVLGLLFYALTSARAPRVCDTYIGGEIMSETYVHGEAASGVRDLEVTGVDFYGTVEELSPLKTLYEGARRRLFDIYNVGAKTIFYFVGALRAVHTGLLPLYVSWAFAGLVLILYFLMRGPNG